MAERPKNYDPKEIEPRWYAEWMARGYFHADAAAPKAPFAIVIPPPNVTGSLHMGHALGDTIEDIFTRWQRMAAYNALWLPGTDHAGIATQMVVERELRETEKKSRHDLGREEFVERVWEWSRPHRRPHPRAAQAPRLLAGLGPRRFTMDPAVLGGGARGLRPPLRRGADLPRAPADQLVPVVSHGAVGPRGRARRGDAGRAVRVRVPAGGRLGRGRRRDDAPGDDAGRHRGRRPPRRSALQGDDRQDGARIRCWRARSRSSPTRSWSIRSSAPAR